MKRHISLILASALILSVGASARVSIGDTNVEVIGPAKALYGTTYAGNPVRIIEVDSSGAIEIDNGAAGASFSGALTVDGALTLSGATGISADTTISSDADIIHNGMTVVRDVISLGDDEGVTLDAAVTGVLEVWVEGDNEYALIHIQDDGTVATATVLIGSVALTDSDTDLSVYDVGTAARIKNRLGATKNIVYEHRYK
jgi:hypothetical protein